MTGTTITHDAATVALRSAVFADPGLQRRLAAASQPDDFAALLADEARGRGIHLTADRIAQALAPDPLGLARFSHAPPDGTRWPTGPWLPVSAAVTNGEATVDWLYFGARRPAVPFFESAVHAAQRLPINRVFRYRMRVADMIAASESQRAPDGLIFHMSRCGSTLSAQMLAALPGGLVLSEPSVLDEILQLTLPSGTQAAAEALRATAAAFARHGGWPYVLKLHCWHALALPVYRRAFPQTPWVFLYRDPVEVLVSHMREPGAQIVPPVAAPDALDIDDGDRDADSCARQLSAVCAAAALAMPLGGGIPIAYAQLPAAVERIVLPHFRIAADARARAAMTECAARDAKAPQRIFTADAAEKRAAAGARVEAAAARHLAAIHAELETMRHAAAGRHGATCVA